MMAQQAQRISLNTCTCFCSTAAMMPVLFGFLLPENDLTTLKRAVWYSGTDEGAAWLRANGAADLADGPPPALLADRPVLKMEPRHIDQLWEWYFATGEEE
nr:hypothetical protein [Deltaproteobacteria bacterium]